MHSVLPVTGFTSATLHVGNADFCAPRLSMPAVAGLADTARANTTMLMKFRMPSPPPRAVGPICRRPRIGLERIDDESRSLVNGLKVV
jgi:hypothetical protein